MRFHAPPAATLDASTTVLNFPPPPIRARAAYLIDMDTHRVLYARHAGEELPMASTTKITTAAVVLQRARLNEMATVSRRAASIGESTMALRRGERLSVRDLLYGLLLNSGNDAAITLAERVGGTEQRFVGMMNQLAHVLHLTHTHYVTPHGLDAPGHYTTARDLATVALYALRDPTFRRIVDTENYYIPAGTHHRVHWLANINHVLYWYPGVNGVKPGSTDAAGLCQVVSVHRDGRNLLAVLLNTPNLVTDVRNLLDYGLRDFRWIQAPAWWDTPSNPITGGSGSRAWVYFPGAGHYLRGRYLRYFQTHGGMQALGYPLTEAMRIGRRTEQFFQGGVLVLDGRRHSVYPEPLGAEEAARLHVHLAHAPTRPSPVFRRLFRTLGGSGVLGRPLGRPRQVHGREVQFFRYAAFALTHGTAHLLPLGQSALASRGWWPRSGAPDVYPTEMSPRA
jgi:hypothetical protein